LRYLYFILAFVNVVNAGGVTFSPSCYNTPCISPVFLGTVRDYQEEETTFLTRFKVLAAQRPLTNKYRETISSLIATYTDNLFPKFIKIKFMKKDCNGKLCFENSDETQENLKRWDCELSDMLSEAIINKD
jgi:hypothetical protein